MSAHPDIAAAVMAGGKSSRLGKLAQTGPKCLLKLPLGETLLSRLVGQLRDAKIRKALVCCSPENFSAIHSVLLSLEGAMGIPGPALDAVACAHCRLGPLPALAETLSKVRAPWYLLCLADVVFATAPFRKALEHLVASPVDGVLITGADQTAADGTGSGFVDYEQGIVRAISYGPFESSLLTGHRCLRWSGSFLFRAELLKCDHELLEYGAAPIENWIQKLLERGARCAWTDGGPFFNVNTGEDYRALLASCRPGAQVARLNANQPHAWSCLG